MKNQIFELKEVELNKVSAGEMLDDLRDVGAGAFIGLPGVGLLAAKGLLNKCLNIMFSPVERAAAATGNLTNVRKLKAKLEKNVKIMTITGAVSGVLACCAVGATAAKLGYDCGRKSKETAKT